MSKNATGDHLPPSSEEKDVPLIVVHLSREGWFWFVTVRNKLYHSSAERYETKLQAYEAGMEAYPNALATMPHE